VGLDRRLGQEQLARHLGVRPASSDELEHLELTLGQLGKRRSRFGVRPGEEVLDQPAGDGGREQRVARVVARTAATSSGGSTHEPFTVVLSR
jgi:hypothetical protein